jgi:hypothetical protein
VLLLRAHHADVLEVGFCKRTAVDRHLHHLFGDSFEMPKERPGFTGGDPTVWVRLPFSVLSLVRRPTVPSLSQRHSYRR